jgi:hypothetical protein
VLVNTKPPSACWVHWQNLYAVDHGGDDFIGALAGLTGIADSGEGHDQSAGEAARCQ